jgi:hypothetical protein
MQNVDTKEMMQIEVSYGDDEIWAPPKFSGAAIAGKSFKPSMS